MGRSRLWSISWLRHQMFYPYIMIPAAQACESDDLRHAMSPFSRFLSSFSGVQRILGNRGASSKNSRKKKECLCAASGGVLENISVNVFYRKRRWCFVFPSICGIILTFIWKGPRTDLETDTGKCLCILFITLLLVHITFFCFRQHSHLKFKVQTSKFIML